MHAILLFYPQCVRRRPKSKRCWATWVGSVLDPTLWSDDMSSRGLQRMSVIAILVTPSFLSLLDWMPHLFFRVFILGWTDIGLGLKPNKYQYGLGFQPFFPQQIRLGFPAFFLKKLLGSISRYFFHSQLWSAIFLFYFLCLLLFFLIWISF